MDNQELKQLAESLGQPQFYVALKVMRYGTDKESIEKSIIGDREACEKIAGDLSQDSKAVWNEFIGQLSKWRSAFARWKIPTPPEEMVINSLRNIMAQRYIGKTVRLGVFISMDKTKTANGPQNAKFRWLQLMLEPDQPGKDWEIIRAIHWGTAPNIEFGAPYNIVLSQKGDFTTLSELALSDKKLPDFIPGDIRARCRLVAMGQPYVRRGVTERGEYELEGIYVALLVDNKDGTSSLIEGSSLKPDSWLKAPHGKILNTTIVENKGFINIGDWHEAKDQSPIGYPSDIPIIADLSDETAEIHLEEFIIYDAIPGRYWIAEGEKGPIQLLKIESFFSDATTVRLMDSADVQRDIIEEAGDNIIFNAARIRVLVKIQQYSKSEKIRLSRTAYAVWAVDDSEADEDIILPDKLKEDFPIDTPITEDIKGIDLKSLGSPLTPASDPDPAEEKKEEKKPRRPKFLEDKVEEKIL